MSSSSGSEPKPKRNAILLNKLAVRAPINVDKSKTVSVSSFGGRLSQRPLNKVPPPTPVKCRGSNILGQPSLLRSSGSSSAIATNTTTSRMAPINSRNVAFPSHQQPFKTSLPKSPRYRKPPVSSAHQLRKPVSACNSSTDTSQERFCVDNPQADGEDLHIDHDDDYHSADDDIPDDVCSMPDTPKSSSFAERYMQHMQKQLQTDKVNEYRPSSAVNEVKVEIEKVISESDIEEEDDPSCPAGHVLLSTGQRNETIQALHERFDVLNHDYNTLPVESDTIRIRNRRNLLERELQKVEESLHVFSRPKIYVKVNDSYSHDQ